ncbi:MAG: ATP-binding protein [Chloroflexota bacterium]
MTHRENPVNPTPRPQRPKRTFFVSMRWRFMLPIVIIVTLVAMFGAYWLATSMTANFATTESNLLVQNAQAVNNRAVTLYERQRSEAQRVAFTQGIAENIISNDVSALHETLEALARTASLDSIIVTDPAGREVAGVLQVRNSNPVDYAISTKFDLSTNVQVRAIIDDAQADTTGFLQTPQGLHMMVAVPIINDGSFAGVALVGRWLPTLVEGLQSSAVADVTIYDQTGIPYFTTIELTTQTLEDLTIADTTVEQTLTADTPITATITIDQTRYRTLYTPFTYGNQTVGVLATTAPDTVPFVSSAGRQVSAIFVAILVGVTVLVVFAIVNRYAIRLTRVRNIAHALTVGERRARTGMKPADEIGSVGAALDNYAAATQFREDRLRKQLWQQRRERNYVMAVFEAIPEGVVVQDKMGEVVMVNDRAREFLGAQANLEQDMHIISAEVKKQLGREIAAGIYALGDPQSIERNGRMLSAQAAAVVTRNQHRIGTVMLLRDITADVQQAQARDAFLSQLASDVQQPLASLAHSKPSRKDSTVTDFAREVGRRAALLQKMIVDMHELTRYNTEQAEENQRPLRVETLLYAVANDWRQIAQAANLELQIIFNETGHYILGDERRLRYAIGNIVDNAIKYTPFGGKLTLEVKETDDKRRILMRVRDSGVGISKEDLPHIFMPFYRGTPRREDGTVIRVPGMGQGLPHAKQVIEAHGGIMKVQSSVGVGSAVNFGLPLTSGESYTIPFLEDDIMEGQTVQLSTVRRDENHRP